jgi:hypothetical protein
MSNAERRFLLGDGKFAVEVEYRKSTGEFVFTRDDGKIQTVSDADSTLDQRDEFLESLRDYIPVVRVKPMTRGHSQNPDSRRPN